jgi:transposase
VRNENAFIDGTQIEAQANQYTAVWGKNVDRYEKGQREKVVGILLALDTDWGTTYALREESIIGTAREVREEINECLKSGEYGEEISRGTLKEYRKTLLEGIKKLERYQKQRETMGERNSFSKTDPDATFMRMKDGTLKAAYNVQIAVEGEYISGAGIFANPNDGVNLKPFLERMKEMLGKIYQKITVDAGYESEENYAYLEENHQQAYIKPRDYRIRKTRAFKRDISKRENMIYEKEKDEYICANNKRLMNIGTEKRISKSGYESEITIYESEDCEGCPYREKCTKSETNRQMRVSKKLLEYRERSEENIRSEEGKLLRVNRSIQVEGAFGVEKEDHHFRRFLTRGKAGVEGELWLLCFGYNINKLHHKIQQQRCGTSLHPLKEVA